MAPRGSKQSSSVNQAGGSAQFVFSVAAASTPATSSTVPLEFTANVTPGNFKAGRTKGSNKRSSAPANPSAEPPTLSSSSSALSSAAASSALSSSSPSSLVDSPVTKQEDAPTPSTSFSNSDSPSPKNPGDSSRIPRPPNAFILFRSSFIKGNHVDAQVETNHSTLSKIAGLTWNNLPEDERKTWYDKAKDVRAAHKIKFPNYAFKPGNRDTKNRKARTVGPKDEVRCRRIAQLLVDGVSGDELRNAMNQFDEHHVPEIITRFETPVTEKSFRRRRSSADTVTPDSTKDIGYARNDHHQQPALKRRRKATPSASSPSLSRESSVPIDPEMPPLCDPPPTCDLSVPSQPASSFHLFSLSPDDSTHQKLREFSWDQPPPLHSPPISDYNSCNPLSPSPSFSSIPEEFEFVSPKPLTIDTSSFPFDMTYPSSASSDSTPTTPFYEELSNVSLEGSQTVSNSDMAPSYYDLPLEAYDPSSINSSYDISPFANYTTHPATPSPCADSSMLPCYMQEQQLSTHSKQHQQSQDALFSAAAAAYAAAWSQQQSHHDHQQQVSCHPSSQPSSYANPLPLDMAQYMTMMAQPPSQHHYL